MYRGIREDQRLANKRPRCPHFWQDP